MSAQRYGRPQERDWNALGDEEFRALVRGDIEEHYPPELRYAPGRLTWEQQARWIDHLLARNWIAPGWPVEMGGMGLSPLKQIIFREEHERWGAAEYREHGVIQVGPILMRYGTRAQQDAWLPPILRAEHHWAQGYSEPEAGSDLASLRTRARWDGGEYVVDGQKIWTTLAHAATHIYLLARTDPGARKQDGISFLLAEIDSPGITVRPIRDIAGHVELCEVFLEGVRVPAENLMGEENGGWAIAKSLLGHERLTAGSPGAAEYGLQVLASVAEALGIGSDPVFRDRFAALRLDVAHLRAAYARYKDGVARGEEIGPDVSMLKIVATETFAAIADAIIEAAGDAGGLAGEVELGDGEVDVLQAFYRARPAMIYAGTNEIQRNIIATAVLGLPAGLSMAGVLDGMRVVEVSHLIAAPLCGLTLGDMGAEVIKVEPPEGDHTRTLEPEVAPGVSAYFQMLNRGKRGVALDLRDEEARELVRRLIDSADVVVESLGEARGAALGTDFEDARARSPGLVWCSISGYGLGHAGRAIDPTLQASMGMMALTGEAGGAPMRLPVPLVDFATAMYATQSVLAALLRVRGGGGGTLLDCGMVDAAAVLSCSAGVHALNGKRPLRRMGTENPWYVPAANFEAGDGEWVQVMAVTERHWRALCEALGHPEWLENPRFAGNEERVANREGVHAALADAIRSGTAAKWESAVTAAGGFCQRIREIEEAWTDPVIAERGLLTEIEGETPGTFSVPTASLAGRENRSPRARAPRLGEHTHQLATELGLEPGR